VLNESSRTALPQHKAFGIEPNKQTRIIRCWSQKRNWPSKDMWQLPQQQ